MSTFSFTAIIICSVPVVLVLGKFDLNILAIEMVVIKVKVKGSNGSSLSY